MGNEATSTALVPVRALVVWRNVNAEWERLNQNFDRASSSLNDLQKILKRVYEEKNKSFVEGFMQSQEAARKLNEQARGSGGGNASAEVKKTFLSRVDEVLDAFNINTFEVVKYIGEKVAARVFPGKLAGAAAVSGGTGAAAAAAASGSGGGSGEVSHSGAASSSGKPEKKEGFLGKTAGALKEIDLSGAFDIAKSLGEKVIKNSSTAKDQENLEKLQQNIDNAFGMMGEKAMTALRPALDALNNAFKSDQMVAAINFMANVFLIVATAVGLVVDGLIYMMGVIQQNWSVIGPILAAIAFVYLAAMIVQVWSLAVAWLAVNWPILIIIAVIALLIYCLMQSGVTAGEIIGFIAGMFGFLKAVIENIVIGLYNTFIIFSDFLRNLFIDPVFAVKKLFYDLTMQILDFVYMMALGVENFAGGFVKAIVTAVNMVLTKFKAVTDFLSHIPGFEGLANLKVNLLDAEDPHVFSGMVDNIRKQIVPPTSDKQTVSSEKKAFVDPSIAAKQFTTLTDNAMSKFNTKVKSLKDGGKENKLASGGAPAGINGTNAMGASGMNTNSMNGMNNINNVNTVGEVGDVKGSVDISSDDLEMLRDLAEIQAIQNFVQLTPTVQLTTGDIHNAGDIDSIMNKISQKLNEEFLSTAQGVYT